MPPVCRTPPFPRVMYKRFTQILLSALCLIFCYTLLSVHKIPTDGPHEAEFDDTQRNDENQISTTKEDVPESNIVPEVIQSDFTSKRNEVTQKATVRETSKKQVVATGETTPKKSSTQTPTVTPRSCPHYAVPRTVVMVNRVWQEFNTTSCSKCSFHLLSAYLDEREGVGEIPLVRVLMTSNILKPPPLDCLLWYRDSKEPLRTSGRFLHIWLDEWGNFNHLYEPYMLSCPVGSRSAARDRYPEFVSLVEDNCDQPSNVLPVVNNRPATKKGFAVCVKALFFPDKDVSIKLVEWFEALFLLGVNKIFVYEHAVHPNISSVLRHYSGKGSIEVIPFSFPTGDGSPPADITGISFPIIQQKRKFEMIPFNDCLYRNLYSHEFIAVLDADEIIIPTSDDSWTGLLERLTNRSNYHGFRFRNAYFMDDMTVPGEDSEVDQVPEYQHMLKHVYRAENISAPGYYVKSITVTKVALVVHNHFPVKCLTKGYFCNTREVPLMLGRMQHYRKGCTHDVPNCRHYILHKVKDTTIWKYKDNLQRNTAGVLQALNLIE